MENQDLLKQIEELKAQNDALKAASVTRMSLKVTEKGGLSVYGLGRFPVTLYKSQWVKLIAAMPQIEAFIKAHANELKDKS